MIPKITTGGRSFKGAARYYLHDKNASTRQRVSWTHTENLLTDDPDKAWKVMAYTAKEAERLKEAAGQKMTGRKLTKPVFAYSLAWHPEQDPDKEHMLATARKSLEVLGLTEHEAIIIAHRDEPQRHVHILANRVHPLTGMASDTGNSKLKLSDFAREYEREHGKVYCRQREENYRKREQGEKTMYRDLSIAAAWEQSDNGRGFAAALKDKGYQLAQGRKRLVVVDPYGQTHNPTRHLENVRAKEFNQRVTDLDLPALPDAAELSKRIQADNKRRYEQSRKHDEQVAQQQNQIQSRHLEERARAFNRFEDRLARERDELAQHYRLKERQKEIELWRDVTRNPSWLVRLLGAAKKHQARLTELEMTHQNAQARMQERLDHITTERDKSFTALKARQETEKRRELEGLQVQRPAGYVNEDERARIAQHLRERQKERTRPSRDR